VHFVGLFLSSILKMHGPKNKTVANGVISGFRNENKSPLFLTLTQRRILIAYRIFGTMYRSHLQVPSSLKLNWTT